MTAEIAIVLIIIVQCCVDVLLGMAIIHTNKAVQRLINSVADLRKKQREYDFKKGNYAGYYNSGHSDTVR